MPPGDELLANQEWQPVPGAPGLRIYPYLRKIDTISSNSFILDGPDLVVCIDPGGLADQADQLAGEIARIREERPRPLLVILTHVHIDHVLQVMYHYAFKGGPGVIIGIQEDGAMAVEGKDARLMIADILGKEPGTVSVGLPLLSAREGLGIRGPTVTLVEGSCILRGERIRCQEIPLGGGESLRAYHTPGHSPDSICLRAGGILFIGDLLFATAPGVAGIRGWNLEDLIRSLDHVGILLGDEGLEVCCPGHGRPFSPATAREVLGKMATEARSLTGIAEVSPAWAKETAAYARTMMEMVNELLTVLSGRLYLVAHVLDELEESGEAERLSGMANPETFDLILSDFHDFSEEYRQGKVLDIHLALKAGQIVQKLHHSFHPKVLSTVTDATLLRRADRILSDYMTRFRGFSVRPELEEVDPGGLVRDVLEHAGRSPWTGEAIIEAAESGERYLEALVSRIAHPPVFEGIRITFTPGDGIPPVTTDTDRFSDLITGILEEFAGRDAEEIRIATSLRGRAIRLTIEARGGRTDGLSDGKKVRFLREECRVLSGELAVATSDGGAVLTITLPVQNRP
ncbi:MAG TPA: MBL fold metallo-hydrolase [Methanomicrobiales archaeon]|nr:MBL fold metallo-hydrolase [Methanomicrobiales archaeon]